VDQYAGSPGHGGFCFADLTASFINFFHYCSLSSGFYGAGKGDRGRRTDSPSGVWMPPNLDYRCPHLHYPPIFMSSALSAAALPICHGLGQAPNNGGLLIIIILYAK